MGECYCISISELLLDRFLKTEKKRARLAGTRPGATGGQPASFSRWLGRGRALARSLSWVPGRARAPGWPKAGWRPVPLHPFAVFAVPFDRWLLRFSSPESLSPPPSARTRRRHASIQPDQRSCVSIAVHKVVLKAVCTIILYPAIPTPR